VTAGTDPSNWVTGGGTTNEQHYSSLNQINDSNVSRLGLAWYGEFDTDRGQEATPLVIDGVLYTSTAWSKVYAYDAATGKQLWFFDPEVPGKKGLDGCCGVVNRGVAAWNGKIFVGTFDGRLVAIDAKSGKKVWDTQTTDTTKSYTITGAPRVVKGKVLIGNGGAEFGVRGYVSAYDAETGELSWRFYTTPNPENKPDGAASDEILMSTAYKTWGEGAWRETGGGGTAWDAIVYDKDFDQVLIGTGNGTPWSYRARSGLEGDNLFISSIVAVDADTGAYKWHYQSTPAEEWDFTATQPIVLADLTIDGKKHKVAMQAPKNGFFYVLDRSNGELISAQNFVPVNWAAGVDLETGRPIEYPAARYSTHGNDFLAMPGAFGAHNWHPMAYSPKTGLAYIPSQQGGFGYKDDKNYKFVDLHGAWNIANITEQAVMGARDEAERLALSSMFRGDLIAWDPVKQKEVWRVTHPSIGAGGTLATAGNLVFQGTPDGVFHAYKADTGKEVWSYDGQVGIIAGAMSYQISDEQYIAVLSGLGGSSGLQMPYMKEPHAGPGRVLVFKLGGDEKLPPYERSKRPAMVSDEKFTDEAVTHGASLYGNCVSCHGYGTYTNDEVVSDLRRSPMILSKEAFSEVVLGGALESRGMASFADRLSETDVEALRAFLSKKAMQLQADEAVEEAARASGNPATKPNL
jgi:PQQ-dependent dehydrogenase (methanol/ethanol family)